MQTYIGTKIIQAVVENKFNHNPSASDIVNEGYNVVYADGYESWSPRSAFEEAYQPTDAMSFGHALVMLKRGEKVARAGWNGKGMFVYLVPEASYPVQTGAAVSHFGEGSLVPYRAYLALKTAQGDVATWAPSCSDALANDWQLVA